MKKINLLTVTSLLILSGCSSQQAEKEPEFDISQINCAEQPENTRIFGLDTFLQKESINGSTDKADDKATYKITEYFNADDVFSEDKPLSYFSQYLESTKFTNKVEVISGIGEDKFKYFIESDNATEIELKVWPNESRTGIKFKVNYSETRKLDKTKFGDIVIESPDKYHSSFTNSVELNKISSNTIFLVPEKPVLSMSADNNRDYRVFKIMSCPIYLPTNSEVFVNSSINPD